ncbi:MAG TPA: acyl-CoA dehydratase activase-related protein [Clostridiales bacterium]|nr:acyl-CoA dehydratase activase-related protein [Clostridiales bacterium]
MNKTNIKVGIPRGLFYYQFYPLWKSFFEELGAEIVLSDNTTRKILDDGVKKCIDEACLPVKIFHGHVASLKGKVDYLFIPRYTSISKKEYICPKFGGLPDMIRHTFDELPKIIDTEINLRKSNRNALKAAIEIGRYFSDDTDSIKKAYRKAMANYREFRQNVKNSTIPVELLGKKTAGAETQSKEEGSNRTLSNENQSNEAPLNIAILGHGYNLYDNYANMNLLAKLKELGSRITTVDMVDGRVIQEKSKLLNKKTFWYFGTKVLGSTFHLLDRDDIDGIIYIMSFGCGIDSFICDLVERKVRRTGSIPFIIITIDEHSGEAGLNTRIEAFIDMIRWRNNYENNISSYGQPVYLR